MAELTLHLDVGQVVRNRLEGELEAVDDVIGELPDHLQHVLREHLQQVQFKAISSHPIQIW